jgi:carbon starvation protein
MLLLFFLFYLGYKFYAKHLSVNLFNLSDENVPPSVRLRDDVDYIPTKRGVLFGHHYTSIAGAAPIVGPAIAVIYGWLPAVLWVVIGTIFMGAVHDFGALVVSIRHSGRSIGDLTKDIIGKRAQVLFMLIIFFVLLIVIAVFVLIIAILFNKFPATVLPVWFEIPLAITMGYMIHKKGINILIPSLIALLLMYISIYLGTKLPFTMPGILMESPLITWMAILLVYAYVASVLPVWLLLQPRDYINSHELFVGLGLIIFGVIIASKEIVAPVINHADIGAPNIFPFLFITIACGAISGFHSLVASGTTSKQLKKESDAKHIGYGAMIAEGVLAVVAIIACTAGFSDSAAWSTHYASWSAASGLAAKLGAFINGGADFLTYVKIPLPFGKAILGVIIISFAATTLDSATRIQRYIISELFSELKGSAKVGSGIFSFLSGRHPTTVIAVVTALALASINGGKGGMILWPLFGAMNQLLAGLALLIITVYLIKKGKSMLYTALPMAFILFMTSWALFININKFISSGNTLLTSLGVIIFLLEAWLIVEAVIIIRRQRT